MNKKRIAALKDGEPVAINKTFHGIVSKGDGENETKLVCPIAIRSQRIEYEVLCTKAIAARRSTTSKRLTAN